jgi:hypothetical protein
MIPDVANQLVGQLGEMAAEPDRPGNSGADGKQSVNRGTVKEGREQASQIGRKAARELNLLLHLSFNSPAPGPPD